VPVPQDATGRLLDQPGDCLEEGAFARSIPAEQGHGLAALQAETNPAEGTEGTVVDMQRLHGEKVTGFVNHPGRIGWFRGRVRPRGTRGYVRHRASLPARP